MMTEHKPALPTVALPDAADEKTSHAGRSYSVVESKYLTAPVKDNLNMMGITRLTDARPVAIPPNINNTVSSVSTDDQKDDRSTIPPDKTVSEGQKEGFSPSHDVATPPDINNTVSTNDQKDDRTTIPSDNTGMGQVSRGLSGWHWEEELRTRWKLRRKVHTIDSQLTRKDKHFPRPSLFFHNNSVSIYKP